MKREELLQYAQGAIAGIRINADIARIDAKASNLMEEIEKAKISHQSSNDNSDKSTEKESASTTKVRTFFISGSRSDISLVAAFLHLIQPPLSL
ncbi:hypothetical protein Tsubulata_033894 [Turnera subulata]|uniref:Uncharacterized protein n=1 Tax=Turnera subulata TaxID=218843 RepID=A0A9Q0FYU7_9ROSI|nr:hypothetical protein Tsubulata_033894 [Turnera subulata]